MLAAFQGATLRGVANVSHGPCCFQFQLTIVSNSVSETGLSLQVYNAQPGNQSITYLPGYYTFAANTVNGTIIKPVIMTAIPMVIC